MIPFLRPLLLTALMLLPVSIKPARTSETERSLHFVTLCRGTGHGTIGTSGTSAEKLTEAGFAGREALMELPG